jgi:hypothetical protein
VTIIGVISDTHGLLRPGLATALGPVDRILHAGDVDDGRVLEMLGALAPVTVVRGNMDRGAWARSLPLHATLVVEGFTIHVVHDLARLTVDPKAAGIAVVVHGHTHQPRNETLESVLYFNPGSAGPWRAGCPISVGRLLLGPDGIRGEILPLG